MSLSEYLRLKFLRSEKSIDPSHVNPQTLGLTLPETIHVGRGDKE